MAGLAWKPLTARAAILGPLVTGEIRESSSEELANDKSEYEVRKTRARRTGENI
jgi:hypothetical protein